MLRQYRPQLFRYEGLRDGRTHAIGTVPIGTKFRMVVSANGAKPRLDSFIVDAWKPRRISGVAMRSKHGSRIHGDVFVTNGGHLAQVRCLSNGRTATMTDHVIRRWVDLDVHHISLPIPPAVPERKHHQFLVLRTGEGTYFDLDRADYGAAFDRRVA